MQNYIGGEIHIISILKKTNYGLGLSEHLWNH